MSNGRLILTLVVSGVDAKKANPDEVAALILAGINSPAALGDVELEYADWADPEQVFI